MRKLLIPFGSALLLLLVTFSALQVARGQVPLNSEVVLNSETQDGNIRQVSAPSGVSPDQPEISFIDSPTVACVQPDSAKNECFLNWYYLSVDANPSYIITMTVNLIDFGYVARYHGFFQTSIYVPHSMNPQGYKVACGTLGEGGDPMWGKAYSYIIRARASDGLKSANYGSAYCPPYTP